jgi:RNA polymerase subunit RPABC4/transcription elongation factor Spt4
MGDGMIIFWLGVVRDFSIVVALLVWAASVAWAVRDAADRGANRTSAFALALVFPFAGAFVYALIRPSKRLAEARERRLWLQLAAAASRVDRCQSCMTPVEPGFVVCPGCATELRRRCTACGSAVELSWALCPYCGEREEEPEWAEQEPARAAAEVTELKPKGARKTSRPKPAAQTESAL